MHVRMHACIYSCPCAFPLGPVRCVLIIGAENAMQIALRVYTLVALATHGAHVVDAVRMLSMF